MNLGGLEAEGGDEFEAEAELEAGGGNSRPGCDELKADGGEL